MNDIASPIRDKAVTQGLDRDFPEMLIVEVLLTTRLLAVHQPMSLNARQH